MAIAYVKSAGNSEAWGGTSLAVSLVPTAGNTIIVCASSYTAGTPRSVTEITDTAGNTYTRAGSTAGGDSNHVQEFWYATDVATHASNAITVTWSGSAGYRDIIALEYSGLATSSVYDTSATGVLTSSGTTHTSNSATNSQADSLFIAFLIHWDGNAAGLAASSPATARFTSSASGAADYIVSSSSSRSITCTTTNNAQFYIMMAIFKAAAAAGGGSPLLLMDHFNGGVAL